MQDSKAHDNSSTQRPNFGASHTQYFANNTITLRPEAIKAANNMLGSPVGLSTIPSWVMSLFFLSIFLVALIYISTNRYARKETVQGQITSIAGAPRIIATKSGVAEQVLVSEGQMVEAGQELISVMSTPKLEVGSTLSSLSNDLRLNHQEQVLAHQAQVAAKMAQIKQRRQEIQVRQKGVHEDLARLARTHQLQEEKIHIQEETVTAMHKLAEQGLMAAVTVRVKDEALIEAKQALTNLEREIAQQKNLYLQFNEQRAHTFVDEQLLMSDNGSVNAQLAEKRLNAEATYADHITAPSAGIVTALQVKTGSAINANQILAIILPTRLPNTVEAKSSKSIKQASTLEVELWAPSKAIGFVQTGDKVRLMYDSFPYQNFGVGLGVVKEISLAPIPANEVATPINGNFSREQMYRIRVGLEQSSLNAYGKQWPLLLGMSLTADLVLEERSLLDWLLEPLMASKRRSE